ncbi:antitoxin HicB [Bacteroides thetaiotaomicron]|jgi:predicted RNase H-like HicB family nuclease|uniref:type II toxin-antitoxin system HicB family antitoxin n=1 Tax=Bacteroides thetaiotaomicron TaxID=818 RepID=UPI00232E771B|nr:antitoxin HicB [Bacteroides thetaiotaomicron]MDC2012217.1 antitoxin HicB [Bacteroides thetaiotaomicron]MDC2016207.1 antitoxin HicB [Bacteroides thetaiotaomicron]MDC2034269.1 antitoxin HicB [Bacteroides thetaiotaomicron]MDC2039036.1 antitoxin HicB [Bacteroides thetaiotaomicron]MDC2043529.1 antitoxin HicB [Bacteroides thetaiotaomicron]
MKTIKVIIERAEHNYSAYLDGVDGIVATGSSVEEIKMNMYEAINALIDECKEFGCEVPEVLTGDYELVFKMDVKSLLDFYSGIFSKAGLERITGINQKQLWHYASGGRKPRPEQAIKLESALHKLGEELLSISL